MKPRHWIRYIVLVCALLTAFPAAGQIPHPQSPAAAPEGPYKFKAAGEHPAYEWFFLVTDAGKGQGIWAKNGLDPEFVSAAGSSSQIKERIDAGTKIGFANAAEVTLARA